MGGQDASLLQQDQRPPAGIDLDRQGDEVKKNGGGEKAYARLNQQIGKKPVQDKPRPAR